MSSKSSKSFTASFMGFVASLVVALPACGPGPGLCTTGKNVVAGVALATMSGENCDATVSGTVDDSGGRTSVSVGCAPPTVRYPSENPSQRFDITLPDPRAWDATSVISARVTVVDSRPGSSVSVSGPVDAKLDVLESAGSKALLPRAASDDFVRHVTVRLSNTGGADVTVDLTVRANDLRTADQMCGD